LYFETDVGDGFREPGFSKERRLDPQITIGLLTGASGFPLMVSAFEGNKAEIKTMPDLATADSGGCMSFGCGPLSIRRLTRLTGCAPSARRFNGSEAGFSHVRHGA
jgi:hypothetical protein